MTAFTQDPTLATLISRQARKAHLAAIWAERACLRPGMKLLDIGAGTGALTARYAAVTGTGSGPAQGQVFAIEPGAAVIDYLRAAHPALIALQQDAATPFVLPCLVDRVFITDTLHHTADPAAILRNVKSVMAPGAVLFIAEYHPAGAGKYGAPPATRLAPALLLNLLGAAGFTPGAPEPGPDEHYTIIATLGERPS
ncbi:MAG TPA: methyltransferase [Acetobacteraceae bacterium]|nr:methyltransferase [Acetobacteraceae bacterium]